MYKWLRNSVERCKIFWSDVRIPGHFFYILGRFVEEGLGIHVWKQMDLLLSDKQVRGRLFYSFVKPFGQSSLPVDYELF